jgi:hypothetical protein
LTLTLRRKPRPKQSGGATLRNPYGENMTGR